MRPRFGTADATRSIWQELLYQQHPSFPIDIISIALFIEDVDRLSARN